ncbi:MAG: hypothetical protein ABWX67_15550 [Allosphingosinicella sp.]
MSFKMILAATAALAMAAGTPAVAAKSQNQNQQAVAADAGGGSGGAKKICRTFRNTVSRMKAEKLCLTRAGWKKFEQEQSQ